MSEKNEIELKPCPFCGSEAVIKQFICKGCYRAACTNIHCPGDAHSTVCDTPEAAAANWNIRVAEAVGNAAAMCEALKNIAAYAQEAKCHTTDAHILGYLDQIESWAKAALAAPPRNADVGTAEEQAERYKKQPGGIYHTLTLTDALEWAQRPYGKGGGK